MALLMVSTEAIIQVLWITGPVTTSLWISAPMPCLPDAEALPVGSRCAARIWIDNRAVVSVEDDPPQVLVGELSATDLDAVRRYIALNRSAILDHWHERTDGVELARTLRPLPDVANKEQLGEADLRAWC